MMKRLLCAALLALAFASCDKDPAGLLPEPTPAGAASTATGRPTPPAPAPDSITPPPPPAPQGIVVDHELVEYPEVFEDIPERLHGRIKTIRESEDGNLTCTYRFSADGRLEEVEWNRRSERTNYRYNEKGQLIEYISRGNDWMVRSTYTYDDTGNLVRLVDYDSDGTVTRDFSFVYDFSAMTYRATDSVVNTTVGADAWRTAYAVGRFDAQGKTIEATSYNIAGYITYKQTRTATSRHIERLTQSFDHTGRERTEIEVETINWTLSGSGDFETGTELVVRLDQDRNELRRSPLSTSTFSYLTRDQYGNWTKMSKVIKDADDADTIIYTREITYY